ncbi:MAG TPA: NAD-dependent epimerase/dehydratase family protein [Anaerolineales bacterium]|nr:NAD-dependent epimerase/dehydratase family protein [Anaerolineales bacterium]
MIFVTGATGFLGHHLIPALTQTGHPVRALVRPTSRADFLKQYNVEIVTGDLLNRDSLIAAMKGCKSVIHAGGLFRLWGEQKMFEAVNVQGTAHMLEAALRVGIQRFVQVSSVAVIGAPVNGGVIDEAYPCKPDDFYQRSKYDAENMVRMFAVSTRFPAVIVRPGAYYGPWGHYAWNRLFFEDPMRGLRIQVHKGRRLTFPVFVPDVAQGVIAALERGQLGETYNLSGDPITHTEANAVISKLLGISPWRLNCPAGLMLWLANQMARLAEETHREPYYPLALAKYVFYDWNVSSAKARQELAWKSTPFEDGARQTVEWYRETGWGKLKK